MSTNADVVRVLAAVIWRNGHVLIGQRPAHKRHGSLWEFPGGKVEPGESDHDAMTRELFEELGVVLTALGAARCVCRDGASEFEIVFIEAVIDGEPVAHEHQALAWVQINELTTYPLAPSDVVCARVLLGGG